MREILRELPDQRDRPGACYQLGYRGIGGQMERPGDVGGADVVVEEGISGVFGGSGGGEERSGGCRWGDGRGPGVGGERDHRLVVAG